VSLASDSGLGAVTRFMEQRKRAHEGALTRARQIVYDTLPKHLRNDTAQKVVDAMTDVEIVYEKLQWEQKDVLHMRMVFTDDQGNNWCYARRVAINRDDPEHMENISVYLLQTALAVDTDGFLELTLLLT